MTDTTTGVSGELLRHTEATVTTKVTRRLRPTASIVYDLLEKGGFPHQLRIEKGIRPDRSDDCVAWDETPTTAQTVVLRDGFATLFCCRGCGSKAAYRVRAEKRAANWVSFEFANAYTCRSPSWINDDRHGFQPNCPDPETEAAKLIREGFSVSIEKIGAVHD